MKVVLFKFRTSLDKVFEKILQGLDQYWQGNCFDEGFKFLIVCYLKDKDRLYFLKNVVVNK